MSYYLFSGDDHERRSIEASTEDEARDLVAELFNDQYRPGEYDDGEPYDGSEFDLAGITEVEEVASDWEA